MLSNTVIQNCIEELSAITKVSISIFDSDLNNVAGDNETQLDKAVLAGFISSPADSQVVGGSHMIKLYEDGELLYVIVTSGAGDSSYTVAKIAVSELSALNVAYKDKYDKTSFFQNLLLDNMLLVDMHNRAKKLRLDNVTPRAVYLIDTKNEMDGMVTELLRGMYSAASGDIVTAVDDDKIILIKSFAKNPTKEELKNIAEQIVSLVNTEVMTNARVTFGNPATELKDVSKSYKEAKLALEVSRIFYEEKSVAAYSALGIGRLIYQLPVNLCEMFIEEVFDGQIPKELDEETIAMIDKFFENNLNVSQTSDQMYVNRNTIIYRLEKIQKATGLNLREFEDALIYKIAMMVKEYLDYLKK